MADILESPLQLRRDAVYMKTEKGIVFRSRKGAFAFSGNSIFKTFQQLVPFLDGKCRGLDLLDAVGDEGRAAVSDLLLALVKRDVLQPVDLKDALLVDRTEAEAFEPQIEFIRHYADRPHERFHEFREKKILLVGSGDGFISAGAALLRNGLKRLQISCPADTNLTLMEQEGAKLRGRNLESEVIRVTEVTAASPFDFEVMIYCAERPDLSEVRRLNAGATQFGYRFLPAIVYGGNIIVGPAVDPLKPGCWECAMLQWSDNVGGDTASVFWRRIALGQTAWPHAVGVAEVSAHMLGNTAAMEAFKLCIGQPQAETQSRLLKQDLSTLESSIKTMLPHPDCAACLQLRAGGNTETGEPVAKPVAVEQCLRAWAPHFDEEFGVFKRFDDESIEQIPLRLSTLEFCQPASEENANREVIAIGWSLENSDTARFHALTKAVRFKAQTSASSSLRRTSTEKRKTGTTVYEPHQLLGWLGTSVPDALAERFLEFTDLSNSERVLVPAQSLHPDFDPRLSFDRHSAGIGVHLDQDGALSAAVLSLYEYVVISQLANGTLSVSRWDEQCSVLPNTTEYLLSTARHLGMNGFDVVVATPNSGVFSAIVLPQKEALCSIPDSNIHTRFSLVQAVDAGLCNMIARAQLKRAGREWTDVPPYSGLYARAEFPLEVVGSTAISEDLSETSLTKVLEDLSSTGKTVLWRDITPLEFESTGTLRQVQALLASKTGRWSWQQTYSK